jgi:DNA-binding LacI/PurR family transcriptional regulator
LGKQLARSDKLIETADPGAGRQPTMADVARLAEVSTAAVSYFMSGRVELLRRIGPDAQERIGNAVQQLGYSQNKAARHLRLQRTERICVLLPRLGIPYADKIAEDIEAVARGRGFSTIVVTGETLELWRRVLSEVEAGLADGVIGDADAFSAKELNGLFEPRGRLTKPRLILHANAKPEHFSVVNYDRLSALKKALDHLQRRGRRRVAYIENTSRRGNPRAALVRDYAAATSGMGLAGIVTGASARDSAAEATRRLMQLAKPPDAILVESDFSAVTVIEELQRLGIDVPGQVAVIGCGNAEEGYYSNPRLTTIGPTEMSLTDAAGHLIDLVENRGTPGMRRFVLPWTLLVRESA